VSRKKKKKKKKNQKLKNQKLKKKSNQERLVSKRKSCVASFGEETYKNSTTIFKKK